MERVRPAAATTKQAAPAINQQIKIILIWLDWFALLVLLVVAAPQREIQFNSTNSSINSQSEIDWDEIDWLNFFLFDLLI